MELPDQKLLDLCRKGDEKAFNVLFRRYFDDLLQFAAKRLNDRGLAEEMVLDLMLKLWQKTGNEGEIQQLDQYLFRCMKNAIISHWRKKALETSSLEQLPPSQIPSGSPTDDLINGKEAEKLFREKLEALSPQRRLVYVLSREQNLSNAEIAQVTQLSVHTVKNHLKASLHYFRKHFKDYLESGIIWLISLLLFFYR